MEWRRNIRLFFVNYGKLLFYIVGGIVLFIFILQSANQYVKEQNNNKKGNTITPMTKEEAQIIQNKILDEKKVITQFIHFLQEEKIEQAYAMLSQTCKQNKYETIEKFRQTYVTDYFSIPVSTFSVQKEKANYVVRLQQDVLATGKQDAYLYTKLAIQNEVLQSTIFIME